MRVSFFPLLAEAFTVMLDTFIAIAASEMFEVLNDKTIVKYLDDALENWLLCADFDGGLA